MKINSVYKGKLDLLIIDIDDTFVYHRAVAVANKIFLSLIYSLFGKKLKDMVESTDPCSMGLLESLPSMASLYVPLKPFSSNNPVA